MQLRTRVFGALGLLLLLMVVGVWSLAGGGIFRPLLHALVAERVDTAVFLAEEVERAPDSGRRAQELARALGVQAKVLPTMPEQVRQMKTHQVERRGRRVVVGHRKNTPVLVELRGGAFLAIRFPTDLAGVQRRIGVGVVLIGLAVLGMGWFATRWILRPLDAMSSAMQRVSSGQLDHRLPEGSDVAGEMGATFNQMASRVEQTVEGQKQLMAGVSHELRTPLTRMRLISEILRDDGADPKRLDALERDIEDMDELVGDLLENARLDLGPAVLDLERIEVSEWVSDALSWVDIEGRELTLDIASSLTLLADRDRLVRALRNLLSNAVRYTPSDAQLTIRGYREADQLVLEVSDNGPGVPVNQLERIFEPFHRLESSRSKNTGGLGLGLMLVRQIVRAHGGSVVAQQRPPHGLTVRLRLPIGAA